MALYYFHLRDGIDVLMDAEGVELAGMAAVAARALMEARFILSQDSLAGRINFDQRIDVEDEHGKIVHSIQFSDAVTVTPSSAAVTQHDRIAALRA